MLSKTRLAIRSFTFHRHLLSGTFLEILEVTHQQFCVFCNNILFIFAEPDDADLRWSPFEDKLLIGVHLHFVDSALILSVFVLNCHPSIRAKALPDQNFSRRPITCSRSARQARSRLQQLRIAGLLNDASKNDDSSAFEILLGLYTGPPVRGRDRHQFFLFRFHYRLFEFPT